MSNMNLLTKTMPIAIGMFATGALAKKNSSDKKENFASPSLDEIPADLSSEVVGLDTDPFENLPKTPLPFLDIPPTNHYQLRRREAVYIPDSSENLSISSHFVRKIPPREKFLKENKALFRGYEGGLSGAWMEKTYPDKDYSPWKIHVFSDTEKDYEKVAPVLMPYLQENKIHSKTLSPLLTPEEVAEGFPHQKGKSFVIYPNSREDFVKIAKDLDSKFKESNLCLEDSNMTGDRKLGATGRLFYRYECKSKKDEEYLAQDNVSLIQKTFYYANKYHANTDHGIYLADDMSVEDDPFRNFDPADQNFEVEKVAPWKNQKQDDLILLG